MPFTSLARRLISDETGIGLVEFAITATVLFTVIFGIMDCSRALYADHYVSHSAREATRYAMVRGASWKTTACTTTNTFDCNASAANVTSYVQSITPKGLNISNLVVATTWPNTTASGAACPGNSANSQGCVVSVKLTYSFNFILPFLPKNALLLSSTSAVTISQ